MVQFDPATLRAARPLHVPRSSGIKNHNLRLALTCAQVCRIVYHEQRTRIRTRISSWAPGERAPTQVVNVDAYNWLAGAYAGTRLWVVWRDPEQHYRAKLGNGRGAGGRVLDLGRLASNGVGFGVQALATPAGLVVVVNWETAGRSFTRYVNVVGAAGRHDPNMNALGPRVVAAVAAAGVALLLPSGPAGAPLAPPPSLGQLVGQHTLVRMEGSARAPRSSRASGVGRWAA